MTSHSNTQAALVMTAVCAKLSQHGITEIGGEVSWLRDDLHTAIAEALRKTNPNSLIYDLLRERRKEAEEFFPDNDSKREGYLEALGDLLQRLS